MTYLTKGGRRLESVDAKGNDRIEIACSATANNATIACLVR
jgi:hypothetical protein